MVSFTRSFILIACIAACVANVQAKHHAQLARRDDDGTWTDANGLKHKDFLSKSIKATQDFKNSMPSDGNAQDGSDGDSGSPAIGDDPSCHAPGPINMPYLYPANSDSDCTACVSTCVSAGSGYDCCVDQNCLAVCGLNRCDLCTGICQYNAQAPDQGTEFDQDACMNSGCGQC